MSTPIVPATPAPGGDLDASDPASSELDAPGPTPPGRSTTDRRRWRRWWVIGAVGAVLVGSTTAAFFVEVPYYVVQPGSVRPAEQRIDISGAAVFDDDGELYFTTVYLNRATPALLVRGWLDDAVEIRTEQEMYPDGDRDGARRLNRQRMDLSKLTATKVALEYLGIESSFDSDGTRVLGVAADSPANGVLRPDDVIVAVDGEEVGMPADIGARLADRRPGETVEVVVRRSSAAGTGEERVRVRLAESPEEAGRAVLGIQAEPANPVIRSDVEVEVDSGPVSGPSAGLAWTLSIIDRLTPGSLTDGRRVAVTGEIRPDGTVGEVGGLLQKTAAVKRAGIRLFLYPADTPAAEQEAMRRLAGDEVELRPVSDIESAVRVLSPQGVRRPS